MHLHRLLRTVVPVAIALALSAVPAPAARQYGPGVSDTEIKIGNTNPYSGPASAYGTIGRTIEAYFRMLNETQGGINGRKIKFISYDDGYSPPKTVEQVRKLVEQDRVLLVFQSLGTPTNTAIHKYMNQRKVPHLFVATGASKWGDPQRFPWTMGWQPNYQTEAAIYATYILDKHPDARIGILYQNDDYGKDYLEGFKQRLGAKAARMIVSEQSYEVTSPTVDSQIVNLKNSGATVFFNITTPKFAAQAIKKAADIGWRPVHLLSNVSAQVRTLRTAGFENAHGILSTTYGKDPDDPTWEDDPDVLRWKEFMRRWYPDGSLENASNLYAFDVAMTLEHVLRAAGDNLTRENVMRQAANIRDLQLPLRLPGITVNTSPTDFAPIEQMQLQRFDGKNGKWLRFGEVLGAR